MLTRFSRDLTDRSARLAGIGLMLIGVLLFSVGDALGKHIVGGYAVVFNGYVRATADIDLFVHPTTANAQAIIAAFQGLNFVHPELTVEGLTTRSSRRTWTVGKMARKTGRHGCARSFKNAAAMICCPICP